MRFFASAILFLLLSCNNSGDKLTDQKDSLDSIGHLQKHIIDSAADESSRQVDSIEKAGKNMVDSAITVKKQNLEKQDSVRQKHRKEK